jgi:dTDP-4-dehydrorhamnose reductase
MENPMKIMIFGGNGLLGNNLVRALSGKHTVFYSIRGESFQDNKSQFFFDASSLKNFDCTILNGLDVIINCIGLADVERCESEPFLANQLNIEVPKFLSKVSYDRNIKLVHISTDHFVANGSLLANEDSTINAVNNYGLTKLMGEKSVLDFNKNSLIIRTNFFGHDYNKNNSLTDWLVSKLINNNQVYGFSDIYFSPVSINFLAEAVLEILKLKYSGVLNVSSNECISKYDFLVKVSKIFQLNSELIESVKSNSIAGRVSRPKNMCLDNQKLESLIDFKVPSMDDMLLNQFHDYQDWIDSFK